MFRNITGILASALFPKKCIYCGALFFLSERKADLTNDHRAFKKDIQTIFKTVMAPFLCPACIQDFIPTTSPLCPSCGFMFTSHEGDDHLCSSCIEQKGHFHKARSVGIHDNTLMTAIHHLKYKGKIQLAKPLGELLFAALIRNYNLRDLDIIIPVPLHIKRLRHRGFNQAYLLIQGWKNFSDTAKDKKHEFNINHKALIRSRHTPPQARLNKQKRKSNLKNAFAVKHPSCIAEKHILLVDDVFTTGATVDECSKVLLKTGARRVDVLTLSRAV